ncbi:hypothetical protein [Parachlamydia sp. AcF125]|uniref:hypothetical protein n=1 Tax=Parachlamydia sp. AcF125 TaxID=2795736 RepID=UPI001BC95E29|nr:hypothetical protein [Parachlamydia sp. AcF125]MBS4169105.1 hypothetical protein [Parachlamydia sp. AcF125]
MMDIEKQFAELLTLTQFYVLQEHPLKDWTFAESQAFAYFKDRAIAQKASLAPAPVINSSFTPLPPKNPPPPLPPKKPPLLSSVLLQEENKAAAFKEKESAVSLPKAPEEWSLEPVPISTTDSFENFQALFRKLFPARTLVEQIPDDAEGKKKSELWKHPPGSPSVVILSFGEPDKQLLFLQNLAKAIEHLVQQAVEIRSAFAIEAAKEWNTLLQSQELRLIIATDAGIHACPHLASFYRETPKQSHHYLGRIPLLLLSDLSLYLKEPKLKLPLWQALCKMLKS